MTARNSVKGPNNKMRVYQHIIKRENYLVTLHLINLFIMRVRSLILIRFTIVTQFIQNV